MKLIYLWIDNYYDRIINQELCVSNSYKINFNIENSTLYISKRNDYIESFYGENISDITAIVGENGAGKTTILKCLYDLCEYINPVGELNLNYPKHIVVYETESTIIVYYYLSSHFLIVKGLDVDPINLEGLQGRELERANQQHDITTVYFTNSFEVSHVMPNQGMTMFAEGTTQKSLCYSPMISLDQALNSLKRHYGAECADGNKMMHNALINHYGEKMCTDFKVAYATATSNHFLTVLRHCPKPIIKKLPMMKNFELHITEFGEYVKFEELHFTLSKFDNIVFFIRKNIYENIAINFETNHWEQMYINILCEIVLFMDVFWKIPQDNIFELLNQEHIQINSSEALEKILEQVQDDEITFSQKELIREIRNVKTVDLNIIRKFLSNKNFNILSSSIWYHQVNDFVKTYNKVKEININSEINNGYIELINLLLDTYEDDNTVYGRMIKVIPKPMSSGEMALINIFSTIYTAMKTNTSNSILLIIDEIDAFLHPRWQQEILTNITRWINESDEFHKFKKKVQLIIATHSPIILSDIPADKIIYVRKGSRTETRPNFTFGARINMLFYDSFFMDQGSIGAIAKREIQWVIDNIENRNLNLHEQKKLVYIINNIGNKFLREKLKSYPVYIEAALESKEMYGKD